MDPGVAVPGVLGVVSGVVVPGVAPGVVLPGVWVPSVVVVPGVVAVPGVPCVEPGVVVLGVPGLVVVVLPWPGCCPALPLPAVCANAHVPQAKVAASNIIFIFIFKNLRFGSLKDSPYFANRGEGSISGMDRRFNTELW